MLLLLLSMLLLSLLLRYCYHASHDCYHASHDGFNVQFPPKSPLVILLNIV